ncbi:response regulator [Paenibacillus sp. GCM10027629]|uniref:response regulator transcription factor n=1 Tax=Paenibacillus sp. GCM10027629 TaxID=3273414 RepID=UPI003625CA13
MRVLLADDEVLTLSMMENLIDWEALSLQIVGKAADGQQALDLIAAEKPDILITDIRMPRMDGLELIKSANAIYPDLKMIIMSAYGEFNYAVEAMKYGVMGYLLKPVDEQELIGLLRDAAIEVERLREMKERVWRDQEMQQETLIRDFLLSQSRPESNRVTAMLPHLLQPYRVVNIRVEGNSYEDQLLWESVKLIRDREMNVQGIWNKPLKIHSAEWVLIIQEEEFGTIIEELKLKMMNQNANYLIGMSKAKQSWEQLWESYQETVEVTRLRFYLADQFLFDSEKLLQHREEAHQDWNEMNLIDEMTAAIVASNMSKGHMLLDQLFEHISDAVGTEPEQMYELCYSMMMQLKIRLWEMKWDQAYVYVNGITSSKLHQYKTWIELKRFMSQLLADIAAMKENQSANSQLIDKAKWYIAKHYNENITLEAICGYIAVSKNYFSSLFKKETGMNVWDYVTELRMEQAKKLIVQTTMKNYEIAMEIGYDNPSYFTKMFKKATGSSPNEYRMLVKAGLM